MIDLIASLAILAVGVAVYMCLSYAQRVREEKVRALAAEAARLVANADGQHTAVMRGEWRYGTYGDFPPTKVR